MKQKKPNQPSPVLADQQKLEFCADTLCFLGDLVSEMTDPESSESQRNSYCWHILIMASGICKKKFF